MDSINLSNQIQLDRQNLPTYRNIVQQPLKKLLDQVRDAVRLKHYSYRTEETYVQWIRRHILFHSKRHSQEMGIPEIESFLTHLAVEGNVTASTQNQVLNAILFLSPLEPKDLNISHQDVKKL